MINNFDSKNTKVKFIKLGAGNSYAQKCFKEQISILGFWTGYEKIFNACLDKNWDLVAQLLLDERTKQHYGKIPKSIKNELRQVQCFFDDDDGNVLWITFDNRKLYWSMSNSREYKQVEVNEERCAQRKMTSPWSCRDLKNNIINVDDLAGHLSMVSGYRGTICDVKKPDYAIRRIQGLESELYKNVKETLSDLHSSIISMMKELNDKDFEVLVETIFTNIGWRRVGVSGGTEFMIDLLLERPSINNLGVDTVAVQIKCKTDQNELNKYEAAMSETYENSFYVYHSTKRNIDLKLNHNSKMKLIDAEELAPLVVETGLIHWLMKRIK